MIDSGGKKQPNKGLQQILCTKNIITVSLCIKKNTNIMSDTMMKKLANDNMSF